MRRFFIASVLMGVLGGLGFAQAGAPVAPKAATTVTLPQGPLLPDTFAGWKKVEGKPSVGNEPGASDPINKEFQLSRGERAGYSKGGRQLAVTATQYSDATGAFSAYTDELGTDGPMRAATVRFAANAATKADGAMFWAGNTLIRIGGSASPADLSELAARLPKVSGTKGLAPLLPQYLPKAGLDAESLRYAVGPVSYAHEGGGLDAKVVDFSKSPEIVTAKYGAAQGGGLMSVIYYPTPTIAGDRSRAIQAALGPSAVVKRSGPLVAVVTGSSSQAAAEKLAGAVKYDVAITMNHPEGYVSEASKTAKVVVGIITLIFILLGATLLLGLFLGGGRALWRVAHGKPASSLGESEFIHLGLRGPAPKLRGPDEPV